MNNTEVSFFDMESFRFEDDSLEIENIFEDSTKTSNLIKVHLFSSTVYGGESIAGVIQIDLHSILKRGSIFINISSEQNTNLHNMGKSIVCITSQMNELKKKRIEEISRDSHSLQKSTSRPITKVFVMQKPRRRLKNYNFVKKRLIPTQRSNYDETCVLNNQIRNSHDVLYRNHFRVFTITDDVRNQTKGHLILPFKLMLPDTLQYTQKRKLYMNRLGEKIQAPYFIVVRNFINVEYVAKNGTQLMASERHEFEVIRDIKKFKLDHSINKVKLALTSKKKSFCSFFSLSRHNSKYVRISIEKLISKNTEPNFHYVIQFPFEVLSFYEQLDVIIVATVENKKAQEISEVICYEKHYNLTKKLPNKTPEEGYFELVQNLDLRAASGSLATLETPGFRISYKIQFYLSKMKKQFELLLLCKEIILINFERSYRLLDDIESSKMLKCVGKKFSKCENVVLLPYTQII